MMIKQQMHHNNSLKIARDIFCITANISKKQLILDSHKIADNALDANYLNHVNRYILGETIARIEGMKNFYGFDFLINGFTLEPRHETELLIELILKTYSDRKKSLKIIDIGTGSGCLAIIIARLYENSRVTALDICENALIMAKENAIRANVENQINFIHNNLTSYDVDDGLFDVILCNPPYIPAGAKSYLDHSVTEYDPDIALFFGNNGLGFYELLADSAKKILSESGNIFIEFGIGQARCIKEIFGSKMFDNFTAFKDDNGIIRAAKISSL